MTRIRRAVGAGALVLALAGVSVVVPAGGTAGGAAAVRDGPTDEELVRAAVADIEAFWSTALPETFGRRYRPVRRVVAGRPGDRFPPCQGEPVRYGDVRDNAFYCLRSDFVAYDAERLIPEFRRTYGDLAVGIVFAHEWGHAVQDRTGQTDSPSVIAEIQADCYAGAWVARVTDGGSDLDVSAGDLEQALAALLSLRDAPGSSPDDPAAHGSAFDRVSAFQDGFESGVARCATYPDDPPVIVQVGFTDRSEARSGGNLDGAEVVPLSVELLDDFFGAVEPAYRPLGLDAVVSFDSRVRRSIPRCGGGRPATGVVRNRVYWCADDDYVAFDEPFLQAVYDEIGDFAVTTLLANPWATRVQDVQGLPELADDDLADVFQADCYTGGFAAALFNGAFARGSLSAGDLDELVQALLVYSRARGIDSATPITFLRLNFVRRGFFQGYSACGIAAVRSVLDG